GGVVSIVYHPCEFVHRQFWDAANFRFGANPPRDKWKVPLQKTPEETKASFEIFRNYVRFMKRFADVRFITASEAVRLYQNKAQGRAFSADEIRDIAAKVGDDVSFQKRCNLTLSPAEVLQILCDAVTSGVERPVTLSLSPLGPTGFVPTLPEPLSTDW